MVKVITYQSPRGAMIAVTPKQERALRSLGVWPKDSRGEEYCTVYRGLSAGEPSYGSVEELLKHC
jgi:hypothetical protein